MANHNRYEVSGRGVYFIQEGKCGLIKIGAAGDPIARLRGLQVGNPRKLNMLAYVRGPDRLERFLHRRLAATCVTGEWFKPTPELYRLMDVCLSRYSVRCAECEREARYEAAGHPIPAQSHEPHICPKAAA